MSVYLAATGWGLITIMLITMMVLYAGWWHPAAFDQALLNWFYRLRTPFYDQLFTFCTWLGSLAVLIPASLVIGIWLWYSRQIAQSYFLLASLSGMVIITHLLKLLIARPRPTYNTSLVAVPRDLSFPSAHTAQITVFILSVLFILWPNLRAPFHGLALLLGIFIIALVGLSRLYLQVHYPTDVLASVFFSMLWIIACIMWLLPSQSV